MKLTCAIPIKCDLWYQRLNLTLCAAHCVQIFQYCIYFCQIYMDDFRFLSLIRLTGRMEEKSAFFKRNIFISTKDLN